MDSPTPATTYLRHQAMSLSNLPNELLYEIALSLKAKDMSSLLLTSHFFTDLTTPLLSRILTTDKDGLPVLCWAAKKGYLQWCDILLKKGFCPNAKCADTHLTPLHYAAYYGNESVVSLLLDNGANIEALDRKSQTPLHHAAQGGNKEVVHTLIGRGAGIHAMNKSHKTALSKSIKQMVKACTREFESEELRAEVFSKAKGTTMTLLRYGSSVLHTNRYGETALHEACAQRSVSVIKLILECGGVITAMDNRGDTPLHIAVMYEQSGVVKFLLGSGAAINAVNNNGDTPLHKAVEWKYEPIVELLVKHGANINRANTSSYTPLALASYRGHERIVLLLLKGRPCFLECCNSRALYVAASHGHERVVRLLLGNGAGISIDSLWLPEYGTALHKAVQKGHIGVVRALLENGANTKITDAGGKCAFCIAVEKDSRELVEVFTEHEKRLLAWGHT